MYSWVEAHGQVKCFTKKMQRYLAFYRKAGIVLLSKALNSHIPLLYIDKVCPFCNYKLLVELILCPFSVLEKDLNSENKQQKPLL